MIKTSIAQAKKFGYKAAVYDLGGLGFGKPFKVKNKSFQENGYYWKIKGGKGWVTRAFHKIAVVKDCLNNCSDFIVYLDGDAVLAANIDEIEKDYDIGVTVRPAIEVNNRKRWYGEKKALWFGGVNAGVMFFNNTRAAKVFVSRWEKEAKKLKNDQLAVNSMLDSYLPALPGKIINFKGIKIRTFDARIYNYYFFDAPKYAYRDVENMDIKKAKILHFKSNARQRHYEHFSKTNKSPRSLSRILSVIPI
ncbi:MAG: hypothetical protein JW946_04470 [Candidatus Omnitrophica bacterium]|nr:hypothetical protein [Candidatus Omnitrophota bacterium]